MSDTLKEENKEVQSKPEISSDMLDLDIVEDNKLVKKLDHETLSLNGAAYKIVEEYREAIDFEMIEARYTDFLEKYDYIVGDISYDKLRLRGFYYSKNKKVPIDMRISSLKDYLTEYCSFGCAYFVLERLEPKKKQTSPSKRKSKPTQNKKNTQNKKQKNLRKFDQAKKREEKSKPENKKLNNVQNKKSFTKIGRKPQENIDKKTTSQTEENKVKTVKNQKGETKFKIRQRNKPE
ncbi:Uncharacterized protein YutD [Marinilactibacillus piezotolerans]|uniref:Uncharacterized protein YutD n=1 Tax=Marinilactibacillus piezotolerans TaxID=258723 RepID=A0A1I4AW87_9LACT|nr:YutD family protein [Marinilactibacillus piezotolerans]SFK60131.1 Uncharacterized protein YutD [Marinilactibacillus piezotolerans]